MVLIGEDEVKKNTVNFRRLTLVGDKINKDGKFGMVKEIMVARNHNSELNLLLTK